MGSKQLELAALILVALGALICLAAGIGRLVGMYYIMGFQSVTMFIGGIAFMVLAVYLKLHVVGQRQAG